MKSVLVTGASGNVGSEVVELLARRDTPVKAGTRSATGTLPPGVARVALDFKDSETFAPALVDVDRVFLMRPPDMADAQAMRPFIEAMRAADIEHVVFMSVQGAGTNPLVPHHGIESLLKRSGLNWTFLRPSFFMQNLSTTHCADIRERDEIFVPAGRGRTNFIDAADVAEAASVCLTTPWHYGKAYEITGSEALTYAQVAGVLSAACGRPISYSAPSPRQFKERMKEAGHPDEFVSVMSSIYALARFGMAAGTTDDFEKLVGRKPTTLAEWSKRNSDCFTASAANAQSAVTVRDDAEPPAFHVMAKPTGARCNLRCDYCFFLDKGELYPGSDFRMTDDVMRAYVTQTIDAQRVPAVTLAWQGGEPTLMGLDFFRRAREVEAAHLPPGVHVERTIQTNGVLLDDEWAAWLAQNDYLVGLSIDGPRELHDAFRHDRAGNPVFDRVVEAARRLQSAGAQFNVMCTVNSVNSRHPLDVYHFFRDELGARYLQFIPIVEVDQAPSDHAPGTVTDRSVEPEEYGRFLSAIFDEWVRRDVGEMFVQFFDGVLSSYLRGYSSLCVLRPTCGDGVALEHNGDVYSCDHFVDADHLLGNIMNAELGTLVRGERQRAFGCAKTESLPAYCRACEYLFACNGECPKNRILLTPDGEPGLNWLCAGLKHFFAHTDRHMRTMADILREGGEAAQIMALVSEEARRTGRNDPCPCGSGRKYKSCCGG